MEYHRFFFFFFFLCSDFYVDSYCNGEIPHCSGDGARVGISNCVGLVCERCAWTWIILVLKDLRMTKSLDARLYYKLLELQCTF